MEARYRRVVDLVELTDLLHGRGGGPQTGITIDDIAGRFEVSRRTAERMLRALRDRYPDLGAEIHHGRKYWRLRDAQRSAREAHAAGCVSDRSLVEGLAHRLDAPLEAICVASRQLEGGAEVRRQAGRMRRIVERSLDLFRGAELAPEPTDPRTLIAQVVEAAGPRARAARVALIARSAGVASQFAADRAQLALALGALVENAIEASPPGARVRLGADRGSGPGSLRFQVDDEGPGVDPACREGIFEPYFTTRDGAAGLGLTLARAIARRHGGTVVLRSTPGRGASFVLEVASRRISDAPGAETVPARGF